MSEGNWVPIPEARSAPSEESGNEIEPVLESSPVSSLGAAQEYSSRVPELALRLYDETLPLHDLGQAGRRLLEQIVQLADQPIPHARKKPMKAALALVRSRLQPLPGDDEQLTLAVVLALHQGKLQRKQVAALDLDPEQVRQALTLTALLRLACGLEGRGDGDTTLQQVKHTGESLLLVVDGPHADADAVAVQGAARLWEKIGYPKVEVLEPAAAALRLLPFPEPTDRIGLTADDPLAEAGRKLLLFQFARMLSLEDGTRQGEDIEALHHMRVATRRLRAAFDVFAEAFEPGALKPYLQGMRRTGRALGAVRDLDVFMEKARAYGESLPADRRSGLDPLMQMWSGRREAARIEMLEYLNSKEYAEFKRKFNVFLHTPGAGVRPRPAGQPVPSTVRDLAPVLIYQRLAAVRAYGPFLDDAPVEMLHMLRIEFKKLRYTLEYFQEALGRRSKVVIDLCKQLQDYLGDLNDAEVAGDLLREFINNAEIDQAGLPVHQRSNLEEVVNYLAYRHAERHRLMSGFKDEWNQRFDRRTFSRAMAQSVADL